MLTKENEKFFGGIKGFAFLPEYSTEIKFFISKNKIDETFDIENAETFKLDMTELEIISKGAQFIANNLKTLIELSKKHAR